MKNHFYQSPSINIQKRVWLLYASFWNHSTQAGTGKFISKPMMLDENSSFSNWLDQEAIKSVYH